MEKIVENAENRISQSNSRALRNPWVLGWIALVTVVLGVNVLMIALAIATNPGLVSKDYYERGRDFEHNARKRVAARNALGWEVNLQLPERTAVGTPALYRFSAVDKRGLPLTGMDVRLFAYRPSDADADFSAPLVEARDGQYEARIDFPLKGLWDLLIQVKRGDDGFELARRISVLTP